MATKRRVSQKNRLAEQAIQSSSGISEVTFWGIDIPDSLPSHQVRPGSN